MLGQYGSLGCSSASDLKCLCSNENFVNGIRDCSYESCGSDSNAADVVAYGVELCKNAGVVVPTTAVCR